MEMPDLGMSDKKYRFLGRRLVVGGGRRRTIPGPCADGGMGDTEPNIECDKSTTLAKLVKCKPRGFGLIGSVPRPPLRSSPTGPTPPIGEFSTRPRRDPIIGRASTGRGGAPPFNSGSGKRFNSPSEQSAIPLPSHPASHGTLGLIRLLAPITIQGGSIFPY